MLAVDAFANPMCTPYATPGTISANLKPYGAAYRQCYSWLGQNQPGVNETDPSDPSACVPDPGGAPPGETGPSTTASKCPAEALSTNGGQEELEELEHAGAVDLGHTKRDGLAADG